MIWICKVCNKEKNPRQLKAGVCSYCNKLAKGYLNDKVKNAAYHMKWYHKNIDIAREIYAERDRTRRATNPAFVAKQEARKERVLNRQIYDDMPAITMVYSACKRMNDIFVNRSFSVDHIIPITHELVSGLHVACNLQVLETSINLKKSNQFPYENQHTIQRQAVL